MTYFDYTVSVPVASPSAKNAEQVRKAIEDALRKLPFPTALTYDGRSSDDEEEE